MDAIGPARQLTESEIADLRRRWDQMAVGIMSPNECRILEGMPPLSQMSEPDTGRQLDEALGFVKMKPKAKEPPEPRKPFPARALRDGPGEAPKIPNL